MNLGASPICFLIFVSKEIPNEGHNLQLVRSASVGPCFRPGMPCEGPSGFTLCVPGKSNRNLAEDFKSVPSGISVKVSKKSFPKTKIDIIGDHACNEWEKGQIDKINAPKTWRERLANIWLKIRQSFSNL